MTTMTSPHASLYLNRDRGILTEKITALLIAAKERLHVIDGGAGRADLTKFWRTVPNDSLNLYGFDPCVEDCERLNANAKAAGVNHKFYGAGLSNIPGNRVLHIASGDSSLFRPNEPLIRRWSYSGSVDMGKHLRVERSITVPCTTVDHWREVEQIAPIDFIKLNVQASELDILQGAQKSLTSVLGLQLEASFVQTYVDQPLFADLDQYVRSQGFTFFDFLAPNQVGRMKSAVTINVPQQVNIFRWPSKQIFEGHFLWLRDPLQLPNEFSDVQILKLVCISEIYGQIEYAFELLHWLKERSRTKGLHPFATQVEAIINLGAMQYQRCFA